MCGINGITRNDPSHVAEMNRVTRHRGPDGTAVYSDTGIAFGHNRLAIIDLSKNGAQPMKSHDGRYIITFVGEIYNYRELREELKNVYEFKTASDTEVLLAAYSVWKEEMFPRLRGMFAFGIWDTVTKELVLARDHMGIKPLFYTQRGGELAFSSEIPALLLNSSEKSLDMQSLAFYLAMEYVPSPRTLVKDVLKLKAGHLLHFKNGVCTVRSFLTQPVWSDTTQESDIYATIDQAVKRQLVSDRPIGAYLSGGFDSSIVVHHMSKYTAHTKTYSVDFEAVDGEESESFKFNDDARLAKQTAAFYGTDHKTCTITLDAVRSSIEQITSSLSEPIANSTALTQYFLSDFVQKDGVVVVLGGDGGDELFGGYTRHKLAMAAYLYQRLPHAIQSIGAGISPRVGKLSTPFFTPLHRALMVKDEKKIFPFLSSPFPINKITTEFFDDAYQQVTATDTHPLNVFMYVDRQTWLPDECFIRSDYASMAHGIELRVPLADIDVVACADHTSIWRKTSPFRGKRVIRNTYRAHLPSYLYSQPKRGWLSPAAKWFRDPEIRAFAEEVFSSGYYTGLDSVFNWDMVRSLLSDHVERRGYYLYPLWNILVLQVWARKHDLQAPD